MVNIYPIAKLGNEYLVINKDDLNNHSGDVKCVDVNLDYKKIYPPLEIQKHLKFNPWEELNESESNEALSKILDTFSSESIFERIAKPLEKF